ncbi:threonine dehydratase [Ignisphaera aggregans DSM 17230]|uniref:threonine ammonia-lyase n=1 Tax=Ignisphaera aggregans (strain DSM 17230 / JCM 13409 / AQ1.S1) TaxID=583356 RepID=E0SQ57_IGNAA|nr:threonine dehydratase [Ignisphaera aggregans DSM 17230]
MAIINNVLHEIINRSREAEKIIRSYIHRTPIDRSETFSRISNCDVYLKYENLQKTGSFKVRGALYKVYKAYINGAKGVVAASAGNHAQGVAYAARVFGLPSIVVMPRTAPISKIDATKNYGAKIILYGDIIDEAEEKAKEVAEDQDFVFIHPYNDIDVIAGQATIAWEILEQLSNFDIVVVPIGGGGLASGIISIIKSVKPSIKIVGVEPKNAPKFYESLKCGKIVSIDVKPSIADGLIAKKPGTLTFEIISKLIDDIVLVDEDEIAYTMFLLLERAKMLVEGAGAVSLAAILSRKISNIDGKKVLALITGGNVDLTSIYRIILKGLLVYGRIVKIRGYVPDVPGTLHKILTVLTKYGCNILEIRHERYHEKALPWHTDLEILMEVPSKDYVDQIISELKSIGIEMNIEK